MYQGQTIFSQVMAFLPRNKFRKCVNMVSVEVCLFDAEKGRALRIKKTSGFRIGICGFRVRF